MSRRILGDSLDRVVPALKSIQDLGVIKLGDTYHQAKFTRGLGYYCSTQGTYKLGLPSLYSLLTINRLVPDLIKDAHGDMPYQKAVLLFFMEEKNEIYDMWYALQELDYSSYSGREIRIDLPKPVVDRRHPEMPPYMLLGEVIARLEGIQFRLKNPTITVVPEAETDD